MYRYIIQVVMVFSLSTITLSAQVSKIEESVPIPRAEDGWLKIFQLKNGNTALVHLTEKDGVNLKLFDSSRKIIIDKKLNPKYSGNSKLGRGESISEIFCLKNDIVFFATIIIKATPTLYRVIIDGNNGILKKEEAIGQLKQITIGSMYAKHYDFVPEPCFSVSKDPNSDNYAVGIFNSFESDRNKRIELVHFGSDHQVLRRSFYNSPNDEFKYMDLIDVVVLGDAQIIACAYVYNKGDDKVSYLALASLDGKSSSIRLNKLDFTKNMKFENGILRYNKSNNLVALFGLAKETSGANADSYSTQLVLFDPNSLTTSFIKSIGLPSLEKSYKTQYSPIGIFGGLPQAFYINDDGTYTIVYEEMTTVTSGSYVYTVSGSAAISVLDDKLKELNKSMIPKSHTVQKSYPPLYIAKRVNQACHLFIENEYKSLSYVNGKNKKYVFINDDADNIENIKKGKIATLAGLDRADAFVFSLSDNTIQRNFLFKKATPKEYSHAMFPMFDYNNESGVYVTTVLQDQKGWKFKVIWVTLE